VVVISYSTVEITNAFAILIKTSQTIYYMILEDNRLRQMKQIAEAIMILKHL